MLAENLRVARSNVRRVVRRVAADRRELGALYAVVDAAAAVAERSLLRPMRDRLLSIEGERGVFGPAHRSYTGHSVPENRDRWGSWEWRKDGEDWTWSEEWKRTMVDELVRPTMSAGGVILEIGPGGGRWSKHLLEWADELILIDITQRTLDLCEERLGNSPKVRLVLNRGCDLPGIADQSVDRVWSFDVFVHVAPIDTTGYLAELSRVLRPGGVAVIHHAGASRPQPLKRGWRSPMTAKLFASLAAEHRLAVQAQLTTWPGSGLPLAFGDVITVLSRA